ncbi:NDP-sugar synthase [Patulibacter brassicae]|uniref:NDP-sugar synthase n=1 Tax=Patulibacter brassicae TaxID=1705717 RepID=A0ABU4VIC9_9ACTN|nr:NDP-sugar synthase [Patulibacter brassicae]MDX8151439.1 NDP-sugar synthase [Patulibacter brassicae]
MGAQAVILVGGKGTRLRPLTSNRPKPIVPLVDRPFMAYMLEWVAAHGVTDVVMCCGFLADEMVREIGDGERFGLSITWVEEPEPRGTAGALWYAEPHLRDERFLMLNGDVLTDMDLSAQLAQHERSGARGTLALVPVEDPTAYGLVRLNDDHSVRGFLEKPTPEQIDTDLISAGAYVLDRSIFDLIPQGRLVSIEREVWPRLVGEGLYGCVHRGRYWMDIGTPQRYLEATQDILFWRVRTQVAERLRDGPVAPSAEVGEQTVVDRASLVDEGARIGARVAIGAGSVVGVGAEVADDVILENAVVLAGARVGQRARLRDCVVGVGATIGAGVVLGDHAMVGDGAFVGEGNALSHGMRLAPGARLEPSTVWF